MCINVKLFFLLIFSIIIYFGHVLKIGDLYYPHFGWNHFAAKSMQASTISWMNLQHIEITQDLSVTLSLTSVECVQSIDILISKTNDHQQFYVGKRRQNWVYIDHKVVRIINYFTNRIEIYLQLWCVFLFFSSKFVQSCGWISHSVKLNVNRVEITFSLVNNIETTGHICSYHFILLISE